VENISYYYPVSEAIEAGGPGGAHCEWLARQKFWPLK
jgi:hypothetical protein